MMLNKRSRGKPSSALGGTSLSNIGSVSAECGSMDRVRLRGDEPRNAHDRISVGSIESELTGSRCQANHQDVDNAVGALQGCQPSNRLPASKSLRPDAHESESLGQQADGLVPRFLRATRVQSLEFELSKPYRLERRDPLRHSLHE